MKRVLIVACNSLGMGGIQTVIMSIVRELGSDVQFDVVRFYSEPNDYEQEFLQYGRIFEVPFYPKNGTLRAKADFYIRPFYLYRSVKKIIKENGPYDALHCHNFFEGGIVLAAAKKCEIPVRAIHSHSCMTIAKGHYLHKLYLSVYRPLIRKNATHKIACSRAAGKYLYGDDKDVIVIPNAINLEKFKYSALPPKKLYSVINIGRWSDTKNQVFLVDVIAEMVKIRADAKLSLVGYGEKVDKDRILKRIEEKQMQEYVTIYPGDTDICKRLCENNIFLLPSLYEGLGIVLIEAQATGLKCFASDRVPVEANLGLVEYLPLEIGAEAWAKQIIGYIEANGSKRTRVDMSSFDMKHIKKQYYGIYNGDV